MKFISAIAAAASICAASPAFSALITFEGIASQAPVTNVVGSPLLVFSGAGALADSSVDSLQGWNSVSGPTGNAGTAVYAQGDSGAYFTLTASGPVGASSFEGPFSFRYSTKNEVTVSVFDGVNSGALASYILSGNDDGSGSVWNLFDAVNLGSGSLSGAKIIQFGGDNGFALYDDITVTAVPLPAALLLFPFGAAALGAAARRRKAAAAV